VRSDPLDFPARILWMEAFLEKLGTESFSPGNQNPLEDSTLRLVSFFRRCYFTVRSCRLSWPAHSRWPRFLAPATVICLPSTEI